MSSLINWLLNDFFSMYYKPRKVFSRVKDLKQIKYGIKILWISILILFLFTLIFRIFTNATFPLYKLIFKNPNYIPYFYFYDFGPEYAALFFGPFFYFVNYLTLPLLNYIMIKFFNKEYYNIESIINCISLIILAIVPFVLILNVLLVINWDVFMNWSPLFILRTMYILLRILFVFYNVILINEISGLNYIQCVIISLITVLLTFGIY